MKTVSWGQLAATHPAMAVHGQRLLYQGAEVAVAFLATTAPDGGPRVHPVFPIIAHDELWLCLVQMSPKFRDLLRNDRFALHSQLTAEGGEEFYLRGRAELVEDPHRRAQVRAATGGRQMVHDFEQLLRCRINTALHTSWRHWGTQSAWPEYDKWVA